jgi:hypothetical protein
VKYAHRADGLYLPCTALKDLTSISRINFVYALAKWIDAFVDEVANMFSQIASSAVPLEADEVRETCLSFFSTFLPLIVAVSLS